MEDIHYDTRFRHIDSPMAHLGRAAAVLPKGGNSILSTPDMHYVRLHVSRRKPENILDRPVIGTGEGTQKWAEEIRPRFDKLATGKIGVNI